MGDYKFIAAAIMDEACCLCMVRIMRGTGFYFEREKRKNYCRECARTIRAKGEEVAFRERGFPFPGLDGLRSLFGKGN